MSITNQDGDILKAFARLKVSHTTQGVKEGDWLETGYAHRKDTTDLNLQTPSGSIVRFDTSEIQVAGEHGRPDAAAAFDCLTTTLRCVLDLEKPMDDEDRERIGRWLLGKLCEGEPGSVRTVRDLTVGELIDLITDAQSHCIVV